MQDRGAKVDYRRSCRAAELLAAFCDRNKLGWRFVAPNGIGHPGIEVTWRDRAVLQTFSLRPGDRRSALNSVSDLRRQLRARGWSATAQSLDSIEDLIKEEEGEMEEPTVAVLAAEELATRPGTEIRNGVVVDIDTGLPVAGQFMDQRKPNGSLPWTPNGPLSTYHALRTAFVERRLDEGETDDDAIADEVAKVSDRISPSTVMTIRTRRGGYKRKIQNPRFPEGMRASHGDAQALASSTAVARPFDAAPQVRRAGRDGDAQALNDLIDERINTAPSVDEALSRGYAIFTRVTLAIGKWQTGEALAKAATAERQLADLKAALKRLGIQ